jgi:transcriptional regulator with XRE-family HTH domain
MDVSLVIRQRLDDLGLEQKDLARAARVTESYVSQLLTRRRPPPAPGRTDIYDKMDKLLKLPSGELARLAELQRKEELKRELDGEAVPLFREVREMLLRKCEPGNAPHVRAAFERQSFGELERFVTQRILDVVKGVARQELDSQTWLRAMARLGNRTYEEMRVLVLEFLDTDVFHLTVEHCTSFLGPLLESWDLDLATFSLDVRLNPRVVPGGALRLEFVQQAVSEGDDAEPGLTAFLADAAMSGTATAVELDYLKGLRFRDRRPTALFYYRALQNLRDPLHFQ